MAFIKKLSSTQILIMGFLLVITVGAILLMLPISSAGGNFTSPLTAFFTATSSTCVTGLVMVDTGTYWSAFGKTIILILIQVGGIGFMSVAFFIAVLMNQRITPKQRLIFVQSMNLPAYDKVIKFFFNMMAFVFGFELTGAILFSFKFIPLYGVGEGIAKSIFHSVSSFCNAGFDLFGAYHGEFNSIMGFSGDYFFNIITAFLIIFGGMGFIVWQNIYRKIRYKERISVYSKLVIITSSCLLLAGTLVFLISEWNNPATIGNDGLGIKLLKSFFQSSSFRTAGFNTIDLSAMTGASKFTAMWLMFIGGSSGSTAGGIKTVTFAILLIAVFRIAKGNREMNILRRRVDNSVLLRAISVTGISAIVVVVSSLLIGITNSDLSFTSILFEVFSAFGTVGVTAGITPVINVFGKLVLIALMFFGRVGIISITYIIMMGLSKEKDLAGYPKAKFLIG